MTAIDLFALARITDPDAAMYEAMAEYRRLIEAANNAHDDDETARFCAEAR